MEAAGFQDIQEWNFKVRCVTIYTVLDCVHLDSTNDTSAPWIAGQKTLLWKKSEGLHNTLALKILKDFWPWWLIWLDGRPKSSTFLSPNSAVRFATWIIMHTLGWKLFGAASHRLQITELVGSKVIVVNQFFSLLISVEICWLVLWYIVNTTKTRTGGNCHSYFPTTQSRVSGIGSHRFVRVRTVIICAICNRCLCQPMHACYFINMPEPADITQDFKSIILLSIPLSFHIRN